MELADGEFDAEDPQRVDAAYFFNPFTETIVLPRVRDFAVDRCAGRAAADIAAAENCLEATRVGMRLVTFCGFGGTPPASYERLAHETWEGIHELWEKRPHK